MPILNLSQPGFTCKACRKFNKHREWIEKIEESSDLKNIYENKLDKACFAQDKACSDSTDLAKRTILDNILKDRAYENAIMLNMMVIKEDYIVWCISFF